MSILDLLIALDEAGCGAMASDGNCVYIYGRTEIPEHLQEAFWVARPILLERLQRVTICRCVHCHESRLSATPCSHVTCEFLPFELNPSSGSKPMQFIVHRGTREIGGSCVELSAGNSRIIVDVGLPLVDVRREPFDRQTLRGKSVEQLAQEGILPNVAGLFDDRPVPQALILSHAHADHTGLLGYTRTEIPVFATKGTSKMMLAGALFSNQTSLPGARYREMKVGQVFGIGDFKVTPFAVDHSAYDSVALLIEAEGKSVLYSGDLRTHGRKPGMAKTLIAEVAARSVDVLLMEGTHCGGDADQGVSEHDLEAEIVSRIANEAGIVLACFSPADVDRLVTYYRATRRTQRVFVADVYTAFIMHLVAGQSAIPRPVRSAGIRVYYNRSFETSYERQRRERLHELFVEDRVALPEILENPRQHLMVFRPSMAKLDFPDGLPPRCDCLYSYWKGYLKNPDWIELQDQVARCGGDFVAAHASGHIYFRDLVAFVKAIQAKTVVPIHTFEPEAFCRQFANARMLRDGYPFDVN